MTKHTLARTLLHLVLAACCALFAVPVAAQTATYVNSTDGAVNPTVTCASPLIRTFTVTTARAILDVDIGIYVQHTYRGDLQITLQSPQGTRIQMVNSSGSISGDNFNVLLDDAASQLVNTDATTATHATTTPPPFSNTFKPAIALSTFNGQLANGTWQLEICDVDSSSDSGNFRHAELYITTALPPGNADLSLTKALFGSPPIQGGTASWRLTVTNATYSSDTATNISVRDTLPAGFTFVSASGNGSFNPSTGIWTVPSLAPGQSVNITISGTVTATSGTTLSNTAEITASSLPDPDSTVNNSVTSEDDYATASLTVQTGRAPGVAPALSCPSGTILFDWDTTVWTAGSTSRSYALANYGNIAFSLSNSGSYNTNSTYGGKSPTVVSNFSGGLVPAEKSLHVRPDQTNRTGTVVITITLPRSFTGVQFSIFDIDYTSGQFADKLTVTGSDGSTAVTPTLTNGNANYVSGSQVIADVAASDTSANGNVVVTFTQPVSTITITFGNHTTGPTNPSVQTMALHDITVCVPSTTLSVTKVSSIVSDPVNGTSNPKAIPGSVVEYVIGVSNTGSEATDASSVLVREEGAADAKLCRIDASGGPVVFTDGTPASGLSYTFTSPASTSDGIEFSNNGGATWTYSPTADSDGCDTAVTDFRLRPTGSFAAGGNFSLRLRYQVE